MHLWRDTKSGGGAFGGRRGQLQQGVFQRFADLGQLFDLDPVGKGEGGHVRPGRAADVDSPRGDPG
jgi:hypothetical protein